MAKYVDSKVWLSVPGGVEGWTVEDLNLYIDRWNSPQFKAIRSLGFFFQWLSHEEGRTIYGFSSLWRSKLLTSVHRIKED